MTTSPDAGTDPGVGPGIDPKVDPKVDPGVDPIAVELLETAELVPLGRILPASNQTWQVRLGDQDDAPRAVYKPRSGERPLWDFADGTLANREYAARLVSEALGWSVVPPTVLRDGPAGPGMVQLWCEPEAGIEPVDLLPQGPVPPGQLHVLDAADAYDRPVMLVHEDSAPLRRMALFDVVVNNTDRKGGHVLAMSDGHRYGVDHGVCFHVDDKLRTVLWGWHDQPIQGSERTGLERLGTALDKETGAALETVLSRSEIRALRQRLDCLLADGRFPSPGDGWPSLPWPPF